MTTHHLYINTTLRYVCLVCYGNLASLNSGVTLSIIAQTAFEDGEKRLGKAMVNYDHSDIASQPTLLYSWQVKRASPSSLACWDCASLGL